MDFVRSYAKSAFGEECIEPDNYPEYVVCHGIVEHARKYRNSDFTNHSEIKAHSNIYRALLLKLRLDDDINRFLNSIETFYVFLKFLRLFSVFQFVHLTLFLTFRNQKQGRALCTSK